MGQKTANSDSSSFTASLKRAGWICVGPIFAVLMWQCAHSFELLEPSLLPSPAATINAFARSFYSGSVFPDLGATVIRMLAGYFLASVVGVGIGLLMGSFKPVYDSTITLVDFFRSIPVTSLYPVFVLTLGVSHTSKIGMVFFASVFVVAMHSAYGVLRANRVRRQMARLYGASNWQLFRWVVFPEALPQTMIGLRIALSYSLIVEVVCEMFMGSEKGIGQRIIETYTTYAIPEMYAMVLVAGVLGFVLNRGFVRLERQVVPWALN